MKKCAVLVALALVMALSVLPALAEITMTDEETVEVQETAKEQDSCSCRQEWFQWMILYSQSQRIIFSSVRVWGR